MKIHRTVCAALVAAQFFLPGAQAQPVTRVKARLTAFDGTTLTLERLPSPAPADAKSEDTKLTAALLPETRFVASTPSGFAAIAAGDYVGAAVTEGKDGALKAQEVYRYAQPLRGTGEGRFTDKDRLLVNGTVTKIDGKDTSGILTLHYRGAALSQVGADAKTKGRIVCEGRATPAPFASALACSADAVVAVAPGTPVTALTVGDKSLLVPGSIVTISITRLADRTVTPGVIVERPASLEKPQTAP